MAARNLGTLVRTVSFISAVFLARGLYVDKGNPYHDGPNNVGEKTFTKSVDQAPLHTKVWFPLGDDVYPAVYFIGGLSGLIPVEFYSTLASKIASHGFFVFGVDPYWPVLTSPRSALPAGPELGLNVDVFFQHLDWLQRHVGELSPGRVAWNRTALLCHSAGCNYTLAMARHNPYMFNTSVFLEPYSLDVKTAVKTRIPAFMYGTQLSEEFPQCIRANGDYKKFYDIWNCPKIRMEIANFGHCEILDPVEWEACHDVHFCKTTNGSQLAQYRQFVQGAASAFLIATAQQYPDAVQYITNRTAVPMPLLDLDADFDCDESFVI